MRFFIGFIFVFPFLFGTGSLKAELSPNAQEAIEKGKNSAKQRDFRAAIEQFQRALLEAPKESKIYYFLGLAESNLPGRELRAISWLSAFLTLDPQASISEAVKGKIKDLDAASRSNLSRLIRPLRGMVNKETPNYELFNVVQVLAEGGEIRLAREIPDLVQDSGWKGNSQKLIVSAQAKGGDIAGALKTADHIQDEIFKSQSYMVISNAQAEGGDLSGALHTARLISDVDPKAFAAGDKRSKVLASYKGSALEYVSALQINAGNLSAAQEAEGLIQEPFLRSEALTTLGNHQRLIGDLAGAKKSLASAQEAAQLIQDAEMKSSQQSAIAGLLALTASTSPTPAVKGDEKGNEPSASPDPSKWIAILHAETDSGDLPPLNSPQFLDLQDYWKSLPSTGDPRQIFDARVEALLRMAKAQNAMDELLKGAAR